MRLKQLASISGFSIRGRFRHGLNSLVDSVSAELESRRSCGVVNLQLAEHGISTLVFDFCGIDVVDKCRDRCVWLTVLKPVGGDQSASFRAYSLGLLLVLRLEEFFQLCHTQYPLPDRHLIDQSVIVTPSPGTVATDDQTAKF